ncbi:MAG: SAM-dependent methyltransferase [Kofleriaceae bacterium]|nr:SAM-dependent methyltransferase [Kofleriaceae bacterium]MCB9570558.1 SAM-dependent methyltransferase [Kofleriaceae bacterium]
MSAVTRAHWAEAFAARARAYWTEARTAALADGKRLLLPPAEAAPLLRALGLLHRDASMPPTQARKYFQVNHMVALMQPGLRALRDRGDTVRLLDAGCGRSYLSLLLAWCARHRWGYRLEILGVDRDPALIDTCARRAADAGLDDVARFEAAALDRLEVTERVDGVIALHACDTATCDAIALGVRLDAALIAVAPCCQAELARGWAALAAAGAAGAFAPVWRSPHLRRETAADVTDAMRAALLRGAGYDVASIEFVPAEHTRKNTLIRATRAGAPAAAPAADGEGARPAAAAAARAEYEALVAATGGVGLALASRLAR